MVERNQAVPPSDISGSCRLRDGTPWSFAAFCSCLLAVACTCAEISLRNNASVRLSPVCQPMIPYAKGGDYNAATREGRPHFSTTFGFWACSNTDEKGKRPGERETRGEEGRKGSS